MNELIKITERNGQRVVDARELHVFLKVQSKFADWIKNRIEKYEFIKGEDYISFSKLLESGGRTKEYALTLDMCKELSMVENNDEGRRARKYFIAVEKMARQQLTPAIPQNFAEALELAAKQQRAIDNQSKEIARLKPKAEFVERSIETDGLTQMSTAVKILHLPYGRNIFFKLLRKAGVFFKNRNEPLQQYVDQGYFTLKQKVIIRDNHPDFIVNTPFLTQKGMVRMSAWLSERGFLVEKNVRNYLKSEK
jgi:anti-repressor protein